MNNQVILIIENNTDLCQLLAKSFQENPNFLVYIEQNGLNGLVRVKNLNPSLVILNVDLDDIDGINLCKSIREYDVKIRILMLGKEDKRSIAIECLEKGADDYLTLPVNIDELKVRVEARLRYQDEVVNPIITCQNITLNTLSFDVFIDDVKIDLTIKEFEILKLLILNKNQVITRDKILNSVWGYLYEVELRAVDIQISKLRKKLGQSEQLIKSIRSFGYKIEENLPNPELNILETS